MSELEPKIPPVMGNEEETGLMVNVGNGWQDPNFFAHNLSDYIPKNLKYANLRYLFLSNGSLVYAGGSNGSRSSDNIERATPECTTPKQVATFIQANEILMVDMAKQYATSFADDTSMPVSVRIQRRVVDSIGNRKGCHDNFSIKNPIDYYEDPNKYAALVGYLATRSFIVGAGYIQSLGFRFSQKIDGLKDVHGYSYDGYMFRAVQNSNNPEVFEDTTGERIEVRCNDINISPWAIQMRLGGMALFLATAQTELVQKIVDYIPVGNPIGLAKEYNGLSIYTDGEVISTDFNIQSLDIQERIIDVFLYELPNYVDLSDEYLQICIELKQFCQDYRKVLKKELPITVLADRADYAAKYEKIIAVTKTWNEEFYSPSFFERAKYDYLYDYIGISSNEDGVITEKIGNGYRLRDRGNFAMSLNQSEVMHAYTTPPIETRANIRAEIIKKYHTQSVEWDSVTYLDKNDKEHSIHFLDPLQSTLSEQQIKTLKKTAVYKK